MTRAHTKYSAWGAFASAVVLAAVAFPTIAQTAQEQRDDASWQARASALDETPADQSVNADLVKRLAGLQTNTQMTPHLIDASLVEGLMTRDQSDLDAAETSQNEQTCLAQAIYYEARSETRSGQKAVAEVVLNRVASKHFPDSICGVVFEGSERRTGCQFSFTCDGSMDIAPKGKSWARSQKVASIVMSGGVKPFTNRATHYHTTDVSPIWGESMRMTRRVGSHVFYRFAPRDYTPSTPNLMVAPPS